MYPLLSVCLLIELVPLSVQLLVLLELLVAALPAVLLVRTVQLVLVSVQLEPVQLEPVLVSPPVLLELLAAALPAVQLVAVSVQLVAV